MRVCPAALKLFYSFLSSLLRCAECNGPVCPCWLPQPKRNGTTGGWHKEGAYSAYWAFHMEQYSSSVTEKMRERPALLPPPFALCHGTIEKQALGLGIMGFFSWGEGTRPQKTRVPLQKKKFKVKSDIWVFFLFPFFPDFFFFLSAKHF